MGKTRKDHKCQLCGKVIPKGTDTSILVWDEVPGSSGGYQEGARGGRGAHITHASYMRRAYYCSEKCKIIMETTGSIDKFRIPFNVCRNGTKLVYSIRGKDIVIKLGDDINEATRRDNRVYRFWSGNGLTMYPEISHRSLDYDGAWWV